MNKELPNSQELEKDVLGNLILEEDNAQKRRFAFRLSKEDFFNQFNQKLYDGIIALIKQDLPTDFISLSHKFPEEDTYIIELINGIATTANFESRVTQLQEVTARRKAIIHLKNVEEELYISDTPFEVIQEVSMDLAKVHHQYKPQKEFTTKDTVNEVNQIVKDCQAGKADIFIPFCIPALDAQLKLLRKQMHILAANSGIGKTAMALSCINKQIDQGYKVGMFCGESPRHELIIRLLSIETNKPFMWFMEGMPGATEKDLSDYIRAMKRLHDHADNLYIFGKGDFEHSFFGIRDIMTCLNSRYGRMDAIYVDYLQNMRDPKGMGKASKEEKVSVNCQELNHILADFDVVGTVMSQLNREASKMKRPYMEQLKYASTIENEAHVVTFLHRAKEALPKNGILETEWYSDKTRVQQDVYAKLAFNCKRAEYTGILSTSYDHNQPASDVPKPYKD